MSDFPCPVCGVRLSVGADVLEGLAKTTDVVRCNSCGRSSLASAWLPQQAQEPPAVEEVPGNVSGVSAHFPGEDEAVDVQPLAEPPPKIVKSSPVEPKEERGRPAELEILSHEGIGKIEDVLVELKPEEKPKRGDSVIGH